MDEEIAFHLDMRAQELIREGLDPDAARRQAQREFGDVEESRRSLGAVDEESERTRGRAEWLGGVRRDLRHAVRTLRGSPGFTVAAAFMLALGIGATAAIFSAVNAVLLRPLPIPEQERVVMLWKEYPKQEADRFPVSHAQFRYWRDHAEAFETVAALLYIGHWSMAWKGDPDDQAQRVNTAPVSAEFFSVLGIRPVLGRGFSAEDERPGAARVAVIGHGFWRERFASDPNAVGRTLISNGEAYTIVGILPAGIRYPGGTEIWLPLRSDIEGSNLYAIGRLKPDVTLDAARAELQGLTEQFGSEHSDQLESSVVARPLAETIVGDVRPALLILFAAVALVLAIAAANVANLLLVRAAARKREFAIRAALGAGWWRVIRQLLFESVLVALLGGALGVLLAAWGLEMLLALAPDTLPRAEGIAINGAVLGFSLVVSLAIAIGFGLAPAVHALRPDVTTALKEGGDRSTSGLAGLRLKRGLAIGQVALALVLLVGAGLLLRSLVHRQQLDRGFASENLISVLVPLPSSSYPAWEQRLAFFERLTARVEGLPGVSSATPVLIRSLAGMGGYAVRFVLDGQTHEEAAARNALVNYEAVGPDHFGTVGIPLIRGRAFTAADGEDSRRVVVINESMARHHWPGDDPIGERLKLVLGDTSPWRTVVGVVGDVRYDWGLTSGRFTAYVPSRQSPETTPSILLARTASDPVASIPAIRREMRAMDADLPADDIATVEQLLWTGRAQPRFNTVLLSLFAAIAVSLAAVGTYGVMASLVTQRTHEIGVRMALGAGTGDIRLLILREGIILTVTGLLLGLVTAVAATRFMASLLFDISPTDPATFAAVAILLAGVALLASYLPARRATRVDPLTTLRCE